MTTTTRIYPDDVPRLKAVTETLRSEFPRARGADAIRRLLDTYEAAKPPEDLRK